jgi:anaerobic ribonucleoside-triphosphate reductase
VLITEFVAEEIVGQNEVLKRDGRVVVFDSGKVFNAMLSAYSSLHDSIDSEYINVCNDAINTILDEYDALDDNRILGVEDIQDIVENTLLDSKYNDVAKAYILYRDKRNQERGNLIDSELQELLSGDSEYWNTENSNKDVKLNTTLRDYIAGIVSTDIGKRKLLPKDVVDAHNSGMIQIHDMDYIAEYRTNCELINLNDILQNGTVVNGVRIDKPKRLLTASTIASQVVLAVTSLTYGGASINLGHLAPFVRDSYNWYVDKYKSWGLDDSKVVEYAKRDLAKEVEDAIQTFNYQINSFTNSNGQSPFLTVFMYLGGETEYKEELAMLIEEMLKQRIQGFKNEKGVYISPAFPKLIYVLEEDNIHEDSRYWYLTELSAKCSAKRLVPDYISERRMKELKDGDVFSSMGCRSFLSVDTFTWELGNIAKALDYDGKHKYWGRFNVGVATVNLVDVALTTIKDCKASNISDIDSVMAHFYEILDERCELCHKGLQVRINRLENTTSDVAPILWQHGALARLDKGETLYNLVHNGYATASLGYAGLYECVMALINKSHTTEEGMELGKAIMQRLNDICNRWKDEENIGYSLYGTPLESTTYKFAKCLQQRFGKIEGITEHSYITNSYHVNVREKIDAFTKLKLESEYQALSPGGCISYVEIPNMQNNIKAVLDIIKYIYDTIMYAELNTKSDYCQECGFSGEIQIKGDTGHLYWECPNCGNTNQDTMNVCRRTCGYLGTNFFNQGRTEEIKDRVLHLD